MAYIDAFRNYDTITLVGIAYRVTPECERDMWVATSGSREWRNTGEYAEARNGTRDDQGVAIVVKRMLVEDLREFILEQFEHYDITITDVNYMKS